MDSAWWQIAGVFTLVLISAFFVAAEYSLVSARLSRISAIAKKGNRPARVAVKALEHLPPYIAGTQLAITMTSIGLGWLGEGALAKLLEPALSGIGLHFAAGGIAFLIVTFLLVVLGELVPKYLVLRSADRLLLRLIIPVNLALFVLRPLTAVLEGAGFLVLRPFGIDIRKQERPIIAKEELAALIQKLGPQ